MPAGVKGARLAAGFPYTATRFMVREFGEKAPHGPSVPPKVTDASIGSAESAHTMTGAMWARIAGAPAINQSGFGKINVGVAGFLLNSFSDAAGIVQAFIRIDTSAGAAQVAGFSAAIPKARRQEWMMFCFTLDNGAWVYYLDGVQIASGSYDHGTGFANATDFEISRNGSYGVWQQTRYWNRVLSATEVAALYYRGEVPQQGLVVEVLCNEGSGMFSETSGKVVAGATPLWCNRSSTPCRARSFA